MQPEVDGVDPSEYIPGFWILLKSSPVKNLYTEKLSPFKRATPGDMFSDGLAPNILLSRLRTLNRCLFNATNTGGKYYFFEKVLDKCVIIIYVQMNIIYYA